MLQQPKAKNNPRRVLIYGWIDLAIFLLILLFVGLLFYIFFSKPMVTTPWPSELSPSEIKRGDGAILASYWSFGVLLVIFIFTHFVLSALICHAIFAQRKAHHNESNSKYVYIKRIGFYFGIFCLAWLPLILTIWLIKKGHFNTINEPSEQVNKKFNRLLISSWKWISSGLMAVASNIGFIFLIAGTTFFVDTRSYYNAANAEKFYQLSSNKPNILYLYYDRTDSWRVRKEINDLDAKHKEAFKDFDFYANSLTMSSTTISSVPYLTFGYNADILDKQNLAVPFNELVVKSLADPNLDIKFPGSHNKPIKQLSIREFYKYALANFVAFWNYLGYGTVNVSNLPYYGSQSLLWPAPDNSWQMNYEMQHEFGFKNFHGTNSNELQIYRHRKVHWNNIDDAYVNGNLCKDLNFVPTDSGVFTAFYSQQDHWQYAIKKGDHDYGRLYGNNPTNIGIAINNSMFDLSEFLNWFKTQREDIYNRTTIIVNSDHGHCFENEPNVPSSPERAAGFAPVFMVKPMKAQSITNADEPFHVKCQLISTADQLAFIRQLIYPNWSTQTSCDPWDPKTRLNLPKQQFSNFAAYRSDFSDENKLWNRTFKVMSPRDWRYMYWQKEVKMSLVRTFERKGEKSVFDKANWTQ